MIIESLCLFSSILNIFVSLAFVPNCYFAKFNSVVLNGSLISNFFSLECHLRNLKPPCRNKVMEFNFNFLNSFILSPPVTKSSTCISSLTFLTTSWKSWPQLSKWTFKVSSKYERWLCKSKHQPSKMTDLNFIIISSFNLVKSQTISLALLNTNLLESFRNVSL